jgi:hypothetical protein
MRRLLVVFGPALFAAACSAAVPAPTVGPTPTLPPNIATPAATVAPAASTRPTPTPVPVGGCPVGSQLTVREYVEADPVCLEGRELTIRAWLDFSPPLGWEGPVIEPAWIAYPPGGGPAALWQVPPTGEDNVCNSDVAGECAWFFAHVDPASRLALGQRRWVVVTGHVADPAAGTCRWVPLDGMEEPLPDVATAIASCRANFVLTSITDAP